MGVNTEILDQCRCVTVRNIDSVRLITNLDGASAVQASQDYLTPRLSQ